MSFKIIKTNVYAAIFAIFVVAPIVWLVMDREPPFKLAYGVTVPKEIKRGEIYQLQWVYYSLPRRCPGTVYYYLIDSQKHIWVSEPRPASFGLVDEIDLRGISGIRISGHKRLMPSDASLGKAQIYITVDFACNITQYVWPLRLNYGPVSTTVINNDKHISD